MPDRNDDRNGFGSGDQNQLVSAVRELSGHARQIKIIILAYAIAMSLVMVLSTWFAFSGVFGGTDDSATESATTSSESTSEESDDLSHGDPLPAISVTDADGRVWTNSDLEGRLVVLNFWATWCPPCREEMPILSEMQERYGDEGLTVIGISVDEEGWEVVRPFIDDMSLNFPVAVADAAIERGFGPVTSLPTTYFAHRDGTVHSKQVGSMTSARLTGIIEGLLERDPQADSETDSAGRQPGADSAGPQQVFRVGPDVESPRLLRNVSPRYSQQARNAKLEGAVKLAVEVGEDGRAHNIRIVEGLGLGLDESAVEAVKGWKFSPGIKDGEPVRVAANIQVRFRLR